MQVTRVRVANVKGVRYVDLTPNKTTTIIGGMNAQGKSSLLDAIAMALGGKALCPEKPIRDGETEATVEVELDGEPARMLPPCTVIRRWWKKPSGKVETELRIVTKDGYEAPTPQTILNDIVGSLGFDPETFIRAKPAEQSTILKGLVGLDFTDLDEEYDRVYRERTAVNTQGKSLKSRVETMPFHFGIPEEEQSAGDLAAKITEAGAIRDENNAKRREVEERKRQNDRRRDTEAQLIRDVERLKAELQRAEESLRNCSETIADEALQIEQAAKSVAELVDPDVSEIVNKLTAIDIINKQVRENKKKLEAEAELTALREQSEAKTARLKQIEEEKASRTAEAKWPIPGLGYTADGVTFQERPFDQASTMEKIEVAVAINAALNPTLKFMFLRHAAMLDDQQKVATAKIAADNGFQLFMEVVGEGEECDIVMSDGELKPSEDDTSYIIHALEEIAKADTVDEMEAIKAVLVTKSDAVKGKLRGPYSQRMSELKGS